MSSAEAENDREKQKSQIESIKNKLRKKESSSIEPQFKARERDRDKWNERGRERDSREIRTTERRSRKSRYRSRSSEDRDWRRDMERKRRSIKMSRSRSFSDEEKKCGRERRRRSRSTRRSRSLSPSCERSKKGKGDRETGRRSVKEKNIVIVYAKLIKGYDEMVLDYFNASAKECKCIFTSGTTTTLKLVGEAFPWSSQSRYIYTMENHNSVLGIREYSLSKGVVAAAVDVKEFMDESLSRDMRSSFKLSQRSFIRRNEMDYLKEDHDGK